MSDNGTEDGVLPFRALNEKKTDYKYGLNGEEPTPSLLERFENPFLKYQTAKRRDIHGGVKVLVQIPEFTSLCPITGQPDYATIVIEYIPDDWCVESKSLKLYLMQYRQFGSFHEAIVDRIGKDLVDLLDPMSMTVQGKFAARGGISFWPTFMHAKQSAIVSPHGRGMQ